MTVTLTLQDYWGTTWALLNSFKHITYPDI